MNDEETDAGPDAGVIACQEYYKQLHIKCGSIIDASFRSEVNKAHVLSHHYINDLEKWINALSTRPEIDLLKLALREYQFALLALSQGQYRQSFTALRLFLELTIAMIYFSSNELELRLWLHGKRDIYWKPLLDVERGVFSKTFVGAFYEDLTEEAAPYRAIAERVYRECSEFVHGNFINYRYLPEQMEFKEDIFSDWHEKAKSIRMVVSFILCVRYLNFIDSESRINLEHSILDYLGHIEEIRSLYGGPIEVD